MPRREKCHEARQPRSRAALALAFLALLASLGGVSYAAIKLPAGSVGAKQLKKGSVGLPQLRVPVGAAAATAEPLGAVVDTGTCVHDKCGPPTINDGLRVSFRANRAGRAIISGNLALEGHLVLDSDHGTAGVVVQVFVDGRKAPGEWRKTLAGNQWDVLPFETSVEVDPGVHVARLVTTGLGMDYLNVEAPFGELSATLTKDIAADPR